MEHGNYVIRGPIADKFTSVAVARIDLLVAKEMIECCLGTQNESHEHLEEACWTTALIRFRRAFTKGRGRDWGHEHMLAGLAQVGRVSYDRFYMLADRFIAHPTGVGEDMAATAVLGPGPDDSVIVYGGTVRKTRVSSPGKQLAEEFLTLLTELIALVSAREDSVHEEFLATIRTWSGSDLVSGGIYQESINFDDSSPTYRKALKKYSKGST